MLVLTRKKDQAIMLGDDIEITLLDVQGDQIRIGIKAPKDVTILRKEVYQEIKRENQEALGGNSISLESLAEMLRKSSK